MAFGRCYRSKIPERMLEVWCARLGYAPMNGHIVELGIGLFLTPLLSILLGVVFYRERLNIFQKISVSLAILGVAIMFWRFGTIPWISLGVSSTWATYGALKKRILLIPAVAIFFESLIAVPFALTFLYYVGESAFFARLGDFEFTAWALVGTGVITSVPLIAYTYATNSLHTPTPPTTCHSTS